MAKSHIKKSIRQFRRRLKTSPKSRVGLAAIIFIGVVIFMKYTNNQPLSVDTSSYRPLLELIARVESRDNYNAYYGSPDNDSIRFTEMTIDEVLAWQSHYIASGSPSDAVGRYQIISITLADLVNQLSIEKSKRFDAEMQDQLAFALLERRGGSDLVNKRLSHKQFAQNLAKEWAALPKMSGSNPEDSYYQADGLNKSLVGQDEVIEAVKLVRAK